MLNHPPIENRTVNIDRHMSYDTMRYVANRLQQTPHIFEDELPENINGVYDEGPQIIVIDQRLNERQKRCTLAHELFHWAHGDVYCQSDYDSKAELHVRRETAILLINPFDYIQAERTYDGEVFLMSVELNVTVNVLEDYRALLNDMPASRILAGIS